jgi:hypothetical protein
VSVLSPALLGAVALVLLVSGATHVLRPAELRSGLASHDVLPRRLRGTVRLVLPVVELGAAGALLTGVAGAGWSPVGPALAAAVLLAALGAYLWLVLRRHPEADVPCACGLGRTPVTGTAVARAGLLAGGALVGGLADQGWTLAGRPAEEALVAAAAAGTLALATALLPAARALPRDPHLAGMPGGAR